jgi:hypothetical protein
VTRLHDLLPIPTGPTEVITLPGWDAISTPPLPPPDDTDIAHSAGQAVRAMSAD